LCYSSAHEVYKTRDGKFACSWVYFGPLTKFFKKVANHPAFNNGKTGKWNVELYNLDMDDVISWATYHPWSDFWEYGNVNFGSGNPKRLIRLRYGKMREVAEHKQKYKLVRFYHTL
jgi:hypothetical protein